MLIGIGTRPCSLSLRDRSMFNYEMTSKSMSSHLKMFLYKNKFLLVFPFLPIPIELWEATAANLIAALIFSDGYYSAPIFFFVELFFDYPFCRFFNILREIFDFSRLVSLFCHCDQSHFKQQLLSKAIQNEERQYKNTKVRNRDGINPLSPF